MVCICTFQIVHEIVSRHLILGLEFIGLDRPSSTIDLCVHKLFAVDLLVDGVMRRACVGSQLISLLESRNKRR